MTGLARPKQKYVGAIESAPGRPDLLRRGTSRREQSKAVGVHCQTIGYLARGEYSPSLHLAMKIAEYFEVPVEVVCSRMPYARLGSETA